MERQGLLSEGAWSREELATNRKRWKGLCKTRYPAQGDGGKGEKENNTEVQSNYTRNKSSFVITITIRQCAIPYGYRRQLYVQTVNDIHVQLQHVLGMSLLFSYRYFVPRRSQPFTSCRVPQCRLNRGMCRCRKTSARFW